MRKKADKVASTAKDSYTRHFIRRVRQQPVFCTRKFAYIDSLPPIEATKVAVSDRNPSRILLPKKNGPFPAIRARDHASTADVDGIHNLVLIEGVFVANTSEEAFLCNTLKSLVKPDEALHIDGCPSRHNVYDKKPSKNGVSKLVDDSQKYGRAQ